MQKNIDLTSTLEENEIFFLTLNNNNNNNTTLLENSHGHQMKKNSTLTSAELVHLKSHTPSWINNQARKTQHT
jgi:hypothetical protein